MTCHLRLELLNDSNLKYWACHNELYKEENKKLGAILELVLSNTGEGNFEGMDVARRDYL